MGSWMGAGAPALSSAGGDGAHGNVERIFLIHCKKKKQKTFTLYSIRIEKIDENDKQKK